MNFSNVEIGDFVTCDNRRYKVCRKDDDDETLLCQSLATGASPMWIGWVEIDEHEKRNVAKSVVNHPPHYTQHPSGVECCDIAEHFNFCVGNAIKYLWRAGLKGDATEDLKKAAWYVQREIERREENST